jgi:hypothetical protein
MLACGFVMIAGWPSMWAPVSIFWLGMGAMVSLYAGCLC